MIHWYLESLNADLEGVEDSSTFVDADVVDKARPYRFADGSISLVVCIGRHVQRQCGKAFAYEIYAPLEQRCRDRLSVHSTAQGRDSDIRCVDVGCEMIFSSWGGTRKLHRYTVVMLSETDESVRSPLTIAATLVTSETVAVVI